ncbi:hypothetical protein M8494_11045 [Serratia ureilytica]
MRDQPDRFYLLNRQRYDTSAIFNADGERYGPCSNTRALGVYFGGVRCRCLSSRTHSSPALTPI